MIFKLVELSYRDLRGDIALKLFDYRMTGGVNQVSPEHSFLVILIKNIIFKYFL